MFFMDNKRKGEVFLIDVEHGTGVIIDENSQDIQFRLETAPGNIELHSKVIFDIQLTAKGLSAMNIELQSKEMFAHAI